MKSRVISCHCQMLRYLESWLGVACRGWQGGKKCSAISLGLKNNSQFIPELDLHDTHRHIITCRSEMHTFPFFKVISLNRQLLDQISFTKISSHMALWEMLQFLKHSEKSRCPEDEPTSPCTPLSRASSCGSLLAHSTLNFRCSNPDRIIASSRFIPGPWNAFLLKPTILLKEQCLVHQPNCKAHEQTAN